MKIFFLFTGILLFTFSAQAKTFHARLVEDLGTLDWNYGEVSPEILYQVMEGLYTTDHLGRPLPALAEKFQWSDGKKKIHFQLRKNLKWSDGAPLCASHFVDSWNRLRSKEFASPYSHYANVLKSFSAPNCQSLDVEFTRPAPEALALFSHYVFFPIRLDALAAHPKMFTDGIGLPCNGAYQIESWIRNQSTTLVRNPNYGDFPDRATIDRIEFQFLPEDSTAAVLFEKKKLDWMKEVPLTMRTPELESHLEFNRFPSLTAFYFGLNAKASSLLADPVVRTALSDALDRDELKKVLGSETRPSTSWLTRELFPDLKEPTMTPKNFDKAKELLSKAVTDNHMDLRLVVYNKQSNKNLAEWAQGQWLKKLGVTIPIEIQEAKVYWSQMSPNAPAIFLSGVTAPYNHPRAFLQEFFSDSSANWTSWKSSEYDSLVAQEKFQKAEELLQKEGYVMPLYSRDTVALVQKTWKGFWINPLGQVFLKNVH